MTLYECDPISHTLAMIISFRHKGLRAFFEKGTTKGIRTDHAKRLGRILATLNRAEKPDAVNLLGWRLHPLKGEMAGFWSIIWTITKGYH